MAATVAATVAAAAAVAVAAAAGRPANKGHWSPSSSVPIEMAARVSGAATNRR